MPIVTKELSQELPNTVASPVDTFVQTAAPPKAQSTNTGMQTFFDAMTKLAPQVGTTLNQVDQQRGDDAEAQANLKALTADPKDLRAEIDSGNYFGMAHRRAQSALRVLDATHRAFEVSGQLHEMEQRGELSGANATQVLHDAVQPHVEAIDALNDPLAAKQFAKTMMPTFQKFTRDVQTASIKQDVETKSATLFGYATSYHDQVDRDAQDSGPTDPAALTEAHKQAMYRTADYAKNHLLLPQETVEKINAQVAQHAAQTGNRPLLDALGSYDRGGAPLKDKYGPQWDAWTKQADAASDKKKKETANTSVDTLEAEAMRGGDGGNTEDYFKRVDAARAADPENFTATKVERLKAGWNHTIASQQKSAADALAKQQEAAVERDYVEKGADALTKGNGYALPEQVRFKAADGVDRTFAKKDYQRTMYQRAEEFIGHRAEAEKWTPEQTQLEKVRLYGRNGDVHPIFQQSFTDLFAGSKAGVPPSAEQLPERLGHLEFLRANDPGQYANLADRNNKQQELWLTSYRAAREFGMDPDRAYNVANQRAFKPESLERLTATELSAKVDDVVKQFGSVGVLPGMIARAKAADAVSLQVAAGVPDKDIVDRAAESLKRSHLIVNGVPVHNSIPGVRLPMVAAEYIKDAADYFKHNNPALRNAPFGVALADDPAKAGSYIPVRTDTMERLGSASVSGDKLKDYVLQLRETERAQAKKARGEGDATAIPVLERSTGESMKAGAQQKMKDDAQRRGALRSRLDKRVGQPPGDAPQGSSEKPAEAPPASPAPMERQDTSSPPGASTGGSNAQAVIDELRGTPVKRQHKPTRYTHY